MLEQSGVTTSGKPVIRGVFQLYETEGIPLSMILDQVHERGQVVDWLDFYDTALAGGAKSKKIFSILEEALGDVYSPVQKSTVLYLLRKLRP